MNDEKLKQANIPEKHWKNCYISADGMIWTPSTNNEGVVLQTGKEAYDYWLEHKDDEPTQPGGGEDSGDISSLKKEIDILREKLTELERGVLNG